MCTRAAAATACKLLDAATKTALRQPKVHLWRIKGIKRRLPTIKLKVLGRSATYVIAIVASLALAATRALVAIGRFSI